ncbi:lysosomal Pro-X carboxypeptidase-like [Epargyreus clarus]|uniref:lysosomal Pro-X carboxypeptidase-like n=1 Tax=Epargyreus clarus TaxID=520877 RepID=UPI003C2E2006
MWYIIVLFLSGVVAEHKYETKWFKVPLDHFGYQRNETFNIKYLVNDDNWDRENGPIFFYTGHEGQIELFARDAGFMWEIASQFRAKLVFAEHRYYGASMPFGNKSLDNEYIGYLTVAQALADYADLVDYLQGHSSRPSYPVITFGGSYGGILAAYFRIKYPHIVTGAIAASAPMLVHAGLVPCEVFNRIVTSSFRVASDKCVENIRHSWNVLRTFLKAQNNSEWLEKKWKLCDPIKSQSDITKLMWFLRSMYDILAMVNYPYPTKFLMPLPANPVRYVCQYLNETLTEMKLIEGISKVVEAATNYTDKSKCVDYKKGHFYGNRNAIAWKYQVCTELMIPMCTNGNEDMFEPNSWNFTRHAETCHKRYNVYPQKNAARIQYGGGRLRAASNIVFSNGLLDPWAGGGILTNISSTVIAVVLSDTAHHLDLFSSNPLDPASVKTAREIHKQNIDKWIKEFKEYKNSKP